MDLNLYSCIHMCICIHICICIYICLLVLNLDFNCTVFASSAVSAGLESTQVVETELSDIQIFAEIE